MASSDDLRYHERWLLPEADTPWDRPPMGHAEILYDVADHVATITLNRPEKLNAWTATMEQEVKAAMEAAASDVDVRVILVTGAGRGFCAGADLDRLKAASESGRRGTLREHPGASGEATGLDANFQQR